MVLEQWYMQSAVLAKATFVYFPCAGSVSDLLRTCMVGDHVNFSCLRV